MSGDWYLSIISRYEVSLSAYDFAKEYYEKCRMYSELCGKATNMQEKSGHVLNETQMSMACLIFSQICLEAYINSFAGEKLPELQ